MSGASKTPASSLSSLAKPDDGKDNKPLSAADVKHLLLDFKASLKAELIADMDARVAKSLADAALPAPTLDSTPAAASASSAPYDATSQALASKAKTAAAGQSSSVPSSSPSSSSSSSSSTSPAQMSAALKSLKDKKTKGTAAAAPSASGNSAAATSAISYVAAFNAFAQRRALASSGETKTLTSRSRSGFDLLSDGDDDDALDLEDASDDVSADAAATPARTATTATAATAAGPDVNDDAPILKSVARLIKGGDSDVLSWALKCKYNNKRNFHEVKRWAELIDLMLALVTDTKQRNRLVAHAARCMFGVKFADEKNNFAIADVLTASLSDTEVPLDRDYVSRLLALTDRDTRLNSRVDKHTNISNSNTRGGGRGGKRRGGGRGGKHNHNNNSNNNNNNANNSNNFGNAVRAASGSGSGGAQRA